ncbi:14695_t:CDS:1 [Entrophospora sp. SA101]|nr:8493_t:CDS:1 [Entrophospora sp. SA101]CAJ0647772.1 14695_t:CDS:1 [Entrophospora sp. SA101]CAJ0823415.1 16584_t:CDS:1 [Entrophospora sp. SA101]CAJ0826890.1 2426_t:CDS:1 [Entrophospora sp. SA101]CAJ0904907.1 10425_t:CDS:1 [Entrophospora sp. SA101]
MSNIDNKNKNLSLLKNKKKTFTPKDIKKCINDGQIVIIYNDKVYKLNKWIKYHPGGELAILHVNGKDATDEINAFHPEYVFQQKINNFYVGEYINNNDDDDDKNVDIKDNKKQSNKVEDEWKEEVYNLSSEEQKNISIAYRKLDILIKEKGLHKCNYFNYLLETIKYILLIYSAWYLVLNNPNNDYSYYILSATFLGAFWHQLAFTAHDAGHNGITHNLVIDNLIGVFISSFCGGLSIGWWKRNHYVHHIVTNHPEHDPDIQHIPFFAITTKLFGGLYSTFYKRKMEIDPIAKLLISYQHFIYYLILCFGRFNLYFLSVNFLINEENVLFRNLEICGMITFWSWYLFMLSFLPNIYIGIIYILISHSVTMLLHVQITLSHFGMCTKDFGANESFSRKMLRTTMDVDCPWWMDWFHGGLQFQAIHHLFPRIPRHNLRKCQPLVMQFCREANLQYHLYGFVKGNRLVLSALRDVANQVELLGKVAKSHVDRHNMVKNE